MTLRGLDHWITSEPDWMGADEPLLRVWTCEACDGSGVIVFGTFIYEPGCGFGHESSDERPCEACGGHGEIIEEDEGDAP